MKRNSFTLIEIVIVVCIICILVAIAIPAYQKGKIQHQAKTNKEKVLASSTTFAPGSMVILKLEPKIKGQVLRTIESTDNNDIIRKYEVRFKKENGTLELLTVSEIEIELAPFGM